MINLTKDDWSKIKMDAIFYIDESGNTGIDWLNNKQPYFVYGGWLIMNENKSEVEKYLKANVIGKIFNSVLFGIGGK